MYGPLLPTGKREEGVGDSFNCEKKKKRDDDPFIWPFFFLFTARVLNPGFYLSLCPASKQADK